ncbi:MAG: FkbM family methyltransferase [Paracoccaceae bacterium]
MTSFATAALFARQLYAELPTNATMRSTGDDRKLAAVRVRRLRELFFALASGADDLIEIGAHHAEASARFVTDRPGRRAFAYEANPEVCAEAVAIHADKPIRFFNVALGDHDGTASFFVPVDARLKVWASLKQRQQRAVEQVEITVPMQTLDAAMAAAGAGRSAIWIDVEGAQLDVFSQGKTFLETSVDAIYVELYDKKMFAGAANSVEVLAFLIERGFVPVARDNQFPGAYNLVAVSARIYADNLEAIMAFMDRQT